MPSELQRARATGLPPAAPSTLLYGATEAGASEWGGR